MLKSDMEQSARIMRMIAKLSADSTSSVEMHSDAIDPYGKRYSSVTCFWMDKESPYAGPEGQIREEFSGPSIVDCLKDALATRGFVEDVPTEADRAEQRMFPTAVAIVRVMEFLWNTRSAMLEAAGARQLPADYVESQRLEIQRAMALAERGLCPILEGLAGYCWVELPPDVQSACREAGIDNPHPWPFERRRDPAKLDAYAEIVGKTLMTMAENIDRQHYAPVADGLIFDSGGRIVDPARIGWDGKMSFADLKALRDRIVTATGSEPQAIPETLWVSAARYDWLLHRDLIDEAGLFTAAGRSYVPAEVKRVRRLSR